MVESYFKYCEREANDGRLEDAAQHAERMLDSNAKTLEHTHDVKVKQMALDEHVGILRGHCDSLPKMSNHLKRITKHMEQ